MLLLPTPHLLYSTVGPQTRFAASERCSSQSALTRLCGRIPIGSGGFTLIRSFLQDTGIANPRQYRHYMPAPNALFISRRFLTLLPHSFVYLSITPEHQHRVLHHELTFCVHISITLTLEVHSDIIRRRYAKQVDGQGRN